MKIDLRLNKSLLLHNVLSKEIDFTKLQFLDKYITMFYNYIKSKKIEPIEPLMTCLSKIKGFTLVIHQSLKPD